MPEGYQNPNDGCYDARIDEPAWALRQQIDLLTTIKQTQEVTINLQTEIIALKDAELAALRAQVQILKQGRTFAHISEIGDWKEPDPALSAEEYDKTTATIYRRKDSASEAAWTADHTFRPKEYDAQRCILCNKYAEVHPPEEKTK